MFIGACKARTDWTQLCKLYTYTTMYPIKTNKKNLKIFKVSRDRSFTATKSKKMRKRFWDERTLKILIYKRVGIKIV